MTSYGDMPECSEGPPVFKPYDGPDRRVVSDSDGYFNGWFLQNPIYLRPGQFYCTDNPGEMIVASVGSGVIVTIHDTELRIGAMGYILIPPHFLGDMKGLDPWVMEKALAPVVECIGEMKRRGAGKNRIRVRLVGGGAMPYDPDDVGTKNFIMVRDSLARRDLPVMHEDLFGGCVRRVHFFPATGQLVRNCLRREEDYQQTKILETPYFCTH